MSITRLLFVLLCNSNQSFSGDCERAHIRMGGSVRVGKASVKIWKAKRVKVCLNVTLKDSYSTTWWIRCSKKCCEKRPTSYMLTSGCVKREMQSVRKNEIKHLKCFWGEKRCFKHCLGTGTISKITGLSPKLDKIPIPTAEWNGSFKGSLCWSQFFNFTNKHFFMLPMLTE